MVVTGVWVVPREDAIVNIVSEDAKLLPVLDKEYIDFVVKKIEVRVIGGGVCSRGSSFSLQQVSVIEDENTIVYDDFNDIKLYLVGWKTFREVVFNVF